MQEHRYFHLDQIAYSNRENKLGGGRLLWSKGYQGKSCGPVKRQVQPF